jgi:hypothetical protein
MYIVLVLAADIDNASITKYCIDVFIKETQKLLRQFILEANIIN